MNTATAKELLLYASLMSALIPIIIGYKSNKNLLWLYPIAGFSFDLLTVFFKRGLHLNHFWIGNVFILTEFIILSLIYYQTVFGKKKQFAIVAISLLTLFVISTSVFSWLKINVSIASLFYCCYIFYGIAGLYCILKRQEIISITGSGFFWMNVAVLIYASGSFLLLLFWDHLLAHDAKLFLNLWSSIFLSLNIVKNILLALSLYYYKKEHA